MSHARYIIGDAIEVLRTLPDASVDMVMTSPPFLALRSYLPADHPDKAKEIGQESNPGAFLDVLLDVVVELRRVLAPHGSLCVELGDTYSGSGGAGGDYGDQGLREGQPKFGGSAGRRNRPADVAAGTVPPQKRPGPGDRDSIPGWPLAKSLSMIPSSFAWALAYGRNPWTGRELEPWRVRNLIAWCRPNPPVGALGDKFRPATSYMTVACVGGSRYFDLDAVRSEPSPNTHARTAKGVKERPNDCKTSPDGNRASLAIQHDSAGAPPLDYWVIPTHPYVTPDGTLHVPAAGTFRQVRVPVGAGGDGIRRTTSPSCPVHGSSDRPGSTPECGGRAEGESTRTGRNGARPAHEPAASLPPTPSSSAPSSLFDDPADLAATPRSTPSNRTAPAPETTRPGTPSAETAADTGRTSASPESSAPHPDTHASRTSPVGSGAAPQGTGGDIAGTPAPLSDEACTCSHYVEVSIATQSTSDYATFPPDWWNIPTFGFPGSHYATYPPDLCVKPIKAMCPERVCRVCGKPSERITKPTEWTHREHPLEREGIQRGGLGSHGDRCANPETLGWTDCDCPEHPPNMSGQSKWRRGVVLDPFAGSGTTLAVATGHGRDAIGIDLDPRNADLARERIGMFLEVT